MKICVRRKWRKGEKAELHERLLSETERQKMKDVMHERERMKNDLHKLRLASCIDHVQQLNHQGLPGGLCPVD